MTDSITPEGGGWTIRCGTHWETFHINKRDALKALDTHKQKCKED